MQKILTQSELLDFIQRHPEQANFDWKSEFPNLKDDDSKGELVKDVSAIANSIINSNGYVIYGVDPRRPEPIIGIKKPNDDAKIQQLLKDKIDPVVAFVYYEIMIDTKIIAVIQIIPEGKRPYVIKQDIGKIKKGQILIRRGSSTEGADQKEILRMILSGNNIYFNSAVNNLGVQARQQESDVAYLRELRHGMDQAQRDFDNMTGLN